MLGPSPVTPLGSGRTPPIGGGDEADAARGELPPRASHRPPGLEARELPLRRLEHPDAIPSERGVFFTDECFFAFFHGTWAGRLFWGYPEMGCLLLREMEGTTRMVREMQGMRHGMDRKGIPE